MNTSTSFFVCDKVGGVAIKDETIESIIIGLKIFFWGENNIFVKKKHFWILWYSLATLIIGGTTSVWLKHCLLMVF